MAAHYGASGATRRLPGQSRADYERPYTSGAALAGRAVIIKPTDETTKAYVSCLTFLGQALRSILLNYQGRDAST